MSRSSGVNRRQGRGGAGKQGTDGPMRMNGQSKTDKCRQYLDGDTCHGQLSK